MKPELQPQQVTDAGLGQALTGLAGNSCSRVSAEVERWIPLLLVIMTLRLIKQVFCCSCQRDC